MWPWLSTESKLALTLLTLLALTPLFVPGAHASPPSSVGPAPSREGDVLWREARAKLSEGEHDQARPLLQRLIDRHPGHAGFTEAHFLLGLSLLAQGKASQAKAPLRYYIEAKGTSEDANRARLKLAEAELMLHRSKEALLNVLEIEKAGAKTPLPRDTRISAKLMKARALHGLARKQEAERILGSAKKELLSTDLALRGDATRLELDFKLAECAQLPGPGASKLDEAQMVSAFERRGQCLAEAVLVFRDLLKTGQENEAVPGARNLGDAHQQYAKACSHPASPRGKRSEREKKQYLTELAALLKKSCRSRFDENLELLESLKSDIPDSMLQYRERVTDYLRKARPS